MSVRALLPIVLVTAASLVGSIAQAQPAPGCAVWSRAENRCIQAAPVPTFAVLAHGIKPLDAATFEQATAAGSAARLGEIANSPFFIAMQARCSPSTLVDECRAVIDRSKDAPFFVTVDSPFTRVMGVAEAAKRTYAEPNFPPLEANNAARVHVNVSPGSSMLTVDTITNLIIKRGGQIIRPLVAQVEASVVQNGMGVKKASADGVFTFDFSAFDPANGPITLVMIGRAGNFEWEMSADDLSRLK